MLSQYLEVIILYLNNEWRVNKKYIVIRRKKTYVQKREWSTGRRQVYQNDKNDEDIK